MDFLSILYPALALGLIALVFGAILGFSSIVFEVKKDKRIEKISEALPNANCGGCGYAGCSAFAEAIVNEDADPSRCNLMNDEIAEMVSTILNKQVDAVKKVAHVKCNGTSDKCVNIANLSGDYTCFSANLLAGGAKACPYGCLGLGSCKDVCKFGAITIKDNKAFIDENKCTGCGACTKACPKKIIELIPKDAKAFVACSSADKGADVNKYCKAGCIACRMCEKNCENGAITVINNLAVIDYNKCTNCGKCKEICPKKVIV